MSTLLICINCGYRMKELFKEYTNAVKVTNCNSCRKLVDKYVEFEPIIVLVDSMLLSQQAYRHLLFNRNFKLFWKLSWMLLLIDSFALWHQKRDQTSEMAKRGITYSYQQGFYICCLRCIIEFFLVMGLMLLVVTLLKPNVISDRGIRHLSLILLKANTLANFSKFFLLPIVLWRENTTDFGAKLHTTLVTGHHLCSLVFVYAVVSQQRTVYASIIILFIYIVREYLLVYISTYLNV